VFYQPNEKYIIQEYVSNPVDRFAPTDEAYANKQQCMQGTPSLTTALLAPREAGFVSIICASGQLLLDTHGMP